MYISKRNKSLEKLDIIKISNRINRLRDGMGFLEALSKEIISDVNIIGKIKDQLYDKYLVRK